MSFDQKDHIIEWLPLGAIRFDERYQRGEKGPLVKEITENFDPDFFGTPEVVLREDGTYWALDGRQRVAGAINAIGGEQLAPFKVHHGLTLQEEAERFRQLNRKANQTHPDIFKARITEGDPIAVAINTIVEEIGWEIEPVKRDGYIAATSALEHVYTGIALRGSAKGDNPEALRSTLELLTAAWGYDHGAVRANIIHGLGSVYRRDNGRVEAGNLAEKFRKETGPGFLVGQGRAIVGRGRLTDGIAFAIVTIHNRGKKSDSSRRLDPWPL